MTAEVSGLGLRALLGAVAFAVLAVGGLGTGVDVSGSPLMLVGLLLAIAACLYPDTGVVFLYCVVAVLLVVLSDVEVGLRLALAAALLHAVHVLAGLAAAVPVRARVEVEALAPSWRRWVLAQVAALPVVLVIAVVTG
ncbi:MAG: hypothetical protein ACRDWI_00600 [Jiangellaceae bacterium]